MRRLGGEKLADYVGRVVRQKQLILKEIESRSGNQITSGYLSGIINNKIRNVSLPKLKALAKGLGVDVYELIAAAMDEPRQPDDEVSFYAQPDVSWLLGIMQEIATTPELLKILHGLVQLLPKDREIIGREIERRSKPKGVKDRKMA